MSNLSERLAKRKGRIDQLEREKKELERQNREDIKKTNRRRNFVIGEICCKYFTKLLELSPGNKQENTEIFKDFELFIKHLSENPDLCRKIIDEAYKSKGNTELELQANNSESSQGK